VPQPYYKTCGGLRFECTKCGDCCTRPGPVYFTPGELTRAARILGQTLETLRRRVWWRREGDFLVVDAPRGGPCPFYDADSGCTVYAARPVQCRTWPFWPETVRRRRSWERAARECEGMNQGPRHGAAQVEAELERSRRAGVPEGDPW
jgi:hypothetical protein